MYLDKLSFNWAIMLIIRGFMKFIFISLSLMALSACADVPYKRKHWGGWTDIDKNCRNTRHEILVERSLGPVNYKDSKKCKVISGKWADFYYPTTYTEARKVDIDHVVPLYEAHKSGGQNWSREKKKLFANDKENLVITGSRMNKKKGAQTLVTWIPSSLEYACRYYERWMHVKKKYDLKISEEELKAVDTSKCH